MIRPRRLLITAVTALLALAVILSGPLLSDTPFRTGVTLAQEVTNSPSDCPGRLAGLPYRSGRGITYEAPDRMDLLCQYRKKNTRSGDPSVSITLFYYAPSADPKRIGGFCWKVRGQPDPEIVTKSPPGGGLQPGGSTSSD